MTLKDTDGFILHGWMVNELHLEGGDLIAFALVHQFTQSGAGLYKGNTSYISAWTGWSERTSRAHLLSLVEKGLIEEVRGRENNSPFCYYKLGKSTPQKFQGDPAKISKSTPQFFPKAPRKNCGEKIHIENTSVDNTTPTPSSFTPPTFDQVVDYCKSRGFADPEGFADYYLETSSNNGWRKKDGTPVTNWKNNVLVWEKYHKDEVFPKRRPVTAARTLSNLSPIYR